MAEEFPKWALEEVSQANWVERDPIKVSGYILDKDVKNRRLDVQFYERLPDGRYIATLDVAKEIPLNGFNNGDAFIFTVKSYEANLSDRFRQLLKEKYATDMSSMWKFELAEFEFIEQAATNAPASLSYTDG